MNQDTQLQNIGNQNLAAIFGNAVAEQNINNLFTSGVNTSDFLPTISIRGREFRTVVAGEESRLKDRHLDVIFITSRPNISKTFYSGNYSGEGGKPDCASSDGVYPDGNIENPVAQTCQICVNNTWGSRITAAGKQGKACSDWRLIVVALASNPDTVFQMRVPASSLKPLAAYVKKLSMMGVPADGAITRLAFADVEYPQLEFDMIATVQSAEQYQKVKEIASREDVQATVGVGRGNSNVQTQIPAVQIQSPVVHAAIQPVTIPKITAPISDPVVQIADPIADQTPDSIKNILAKWGQQS